MNIDNRMTRRASLKLMGAGAAVMGAPALHAQAFPNRPIRIIVPSGPGGGADTFARLMSIAAARELGQSLVIENVPGAGGIVGADRVVRAPKDGYTVLWGLNPIFTMIPALGTSMPFAPADLQPVCTLISNAYVWVARADFPANNAKELIALAKASPGKFSYASTGNGSAAHLGGALLEQEAGISMLHVPFKGTGIAEVMGGQVDLKMEPLGSAVSLIQGGKLKALAVTSRQVLAPLPNVRPLLEVVPGYEVEGWHSVWVAAGTPPAIVETLRKGFTAAIATPDMRGRVEQTGSNVYLLGAAETTALAAKELDVWKKLIVAKKIVAE
ncbi:Bug family tripartite tricarboxylate transporter substrate binding protein [Caenimonas koreensis]|nr:tripartite tricarboxylate transporter substrate binding protein [Caenimonas koreensis]